MSYVIKPSVVPYTNCQKTRSYRTKYYVKQMKPFVFLVLDKHGRTMSSWDNNKEALQQMRILNKTLVKSS